MNYSIFWARLLGLLTLLLSLTAFINTSSFRILMFDVSANPAIVMITGIFTLLLGLAIIISHHVWRGWPIIITLLGYWIIIKGMVLLYFPTLLPQIVSFWQGKNIVLAAMPALIIGLVLLYFGFIRAKYVHPD